MPMPFGKFKGQDLRVLPDDYLAWLVENIALREPLFSAITEEIARRGGEGSLRVPPPRAQKRARVADTDGAWTKGGDPQEIIAGDFPISSRQRQDA